MNNPAERAIHFLTEEAKKIAAKVLIYGAAGMVLVWMTPAWERVAAVWNSPATLEEIQSDVRSLRVDIARAAGEDRIIRQPTGTSYVVEPVVRGTPVVMHLVLQRTRLGSSCRFVDGVSLFTDSTGVTIAGSQVRVQRQIGLIPERIRVDLVHPSSLLSGRVEVYLALEYACNGEATFDRTDTLSFHLVEDDG